MRLLLPTLSYRDLAFAVLIVLFAYALRVIVVFDRAQGDPKFAPLPPGSDQRTYLVFAEQWEQGRWPREPFFYQPGLTYYFVAIRALVGKSLGMMRLVTSLTGALTCGLMVGVGWLLTGRKWGGYLAGLLLAIYPVAIFHSTVLLDPGLSSFYVGLILFLMLWQMQCLTLWRSVFLGVTLGLLIITRSNLGLLYFAWPVTLLLANVSKRVTVTHAAVAFAGMALTIAPVTLWNYTSSGGEFRLVTGVGMEEVYRANSRDSNGLYWGTYPARRTVDQGYIYALLADIRRDPLRFIELQGRKFGIYWSAIESANNISYEVNGKAVSPLLRAIPLDFRILSVLGWLGIAALFYDDRRKGLTLLAFVSAIFLGTFILWIEGRIRQPMVIPMVVAASYGLTRLVDYVRGRQWMVMGRRYAPYTLALLLVFAYGDWTVDHLPQKRPLTSLPADARPLNVVFDGRLRLSGWRPLPEWPAASEDWAGRDLSPGGRAYVVQLFWEVLEPVSAEYHFYLAYVVNGQRYAAYDRRIGSISYPERFTSTWLPGEIYGEIVGFKFPTTTLTERTGDMRVGVYRAAGGEASGNMRIQDAPITSPENAAEDYVILHPLAVVDLGDPLLMSSDDLTPASHNFGNLIELKGYTLPQRIEPGDTVRLELYWEALVELASDYTVFVHVEDQTRALVFQHDSPPREGAFLTSTWPPHYPVRDTAALTLPQAAGTYRVYIGLYDAQTLERLPIDAPDYRLLLGEVVVEPG